MSAKSSSKGIAPPPPRRMAAPPTPVEAPDNLVDQTDNAKEGSRKWADLNFKVDPNFQHLFGVEARLRRLSNKAFLETCVRHYLDANGSKADPERKIL